MDLSKKLKKKYNDLHKMYSKIHIKRDLQKFLKKNSKKDVLSIEQKNAIKEFYKPYKKVSYKFHNFYTEKNDEFYVNYLPDDVYYCDIDMYYNNWNIAPIIDNKCYYQRLLPNVKQPSMIVCRVNNIWFNSKMEIIDFNDVKRIISQVKEIVVKEAYDSSGGHGVSFFSNSKNIVKEFTKCVSKIDVDIIVQDIVKQNKELSKLNPSSLNTIRILSFLDKDGNVKIYSSIIRMGVGDSKVDNASSGGITCEINDDGTLKNIAYKSNGEKFEVHPTSGVKFNTITVPKFSEMKELVKKNHPLLPMSRLISWDLTLNSNEEIVLIEFSLRYGELDFHQLNNGPVFGKDTKKILDEVFRK